MDYIYDITLNFQENYYQFFEWKPEDKIINIPKISIYKVSDKDIIYLKNNEVKVSEEFITKIKKDNKKNKKIVCIVSNGKTAIALLFNSRGYLIKRSSLIFEEEEEVIYIVKNKRAIKIPYEKNNHKYNNNYLRIEKEKKDLVSSYIKNTTNIYSLKYLYYECYERELNDINKIRKILLKELTHNWNENQKKIYNIINILININ